MQEQRVTQDRIIDDAIHEGRQLTFTLKSGVTVKGSILAHDAFTVLLGSQSGYTLVYKHFVTTVFPAKNPWHPKRSDEDKKSGGHETEA